MEHNDLFFTLMTGVLNYIRLIIDVRYLTIIIKQRVCGRISHFPYFGQDNKPFSEDRAGMGPDGEIRGGLHEKLSHSNVGLKMLSESRKREKPVRQNF